MVRRNFAQVLKNGKIDLKNEYTKLFNLFYHKDSRDDKSVAEIVSMNFIRFPFRGTCLSLEEFDKMYKIRFDENPQDFDEEYLVNFMEYVYNLICPLDEHLLFMNINKSFFLNHIMSVVERIGYMFASEGGVAIFVPKDNVAIAVAESSLVSDNFSYKVLEYNHHSMSGNIESKKNTLIKFAEILEPKKSKLSQINGTFTSDLFCLLNSCNIRHNNEDESSSYYRKYIATITDVELEKIYDEIYQMCLLAIMELEQMQRKEWLESLKKELSSKR